MRIYTSRHRTITRHCWIISVLDGKNSFLMTGTIINKKHETSKKSTHISKMKQKLTTLLLAFTIVLNVCAQETVLHIPYAPGKSIYGIISEPTVNKEKHGIAILCHGFNGTLNFGLGCFKMLNELGYAAYSFDFPYGSVRSKTDNDTQKMTVTGEKEALETIVRYFRAQKDIDPQNIILIGESQGGLVSALVAAEMPNEINKLVLCYPAFSIPDEWWKRYPRIEDIPDVPEKWGVKLSKEYVIDALSLNVFGTIGKYTGPVLIMHGTNDKVVPIEYSERAEKIYKDVTLKKIEGAGHGFKPAEKEVADKYMWEFLTSKSR